MNSSTEQRGEELTASAFKAQNARPPTPRCRSELSARFYGSGVRVRRGKEASRAQGGMSAVSLRCCLICFRIVSSSWLSPPVRSATAATANSGGGAGSLVVRAASSCWGAAAALLSRARNTRACNYQALTELQSTSRSARGGRGLAALLYYQQCVRESTYLLGLSTDALQAAVVATSRKGAAVQLH